MPFHLLQDHNIVALKVIFIKWNKHLFLETFPDVTFPCFFHPLFICIYFCKIVLSLEMSGLFIYIMHFFYMSLVIIN